VAAGLHNTRSTCDELTAQHTTGSDRYYTYDAYGNLTASAVVLGGTTAYTYDEANRLASTSPPAGSALGFSVDALGRQWTKSVGGTLAETYGYAATSDSVVQIDLAAGSTSSAVDGMGNRSATATSAGALGWNLPDLHGNVAAVLAAAGSSVSDAFRYDAYGRTVGKTTSSLPTPWRYQGRLQLSTDDGSGNTADLYDFGARAYDPQLGVFTSFDTLAGGAQNPITLNRFLYAGANPATLIDPDGHMFVSYLMADNYVIESPASTPSSKSSSSTNTQSMTAAAPSGSALIGSPGTATPTTQRPASHVTNPGWVVTGDDLRWVGRPVPLGHSCTVVQLDCTAADFDKMDTNARIEWLDNFQVTWKTRGYFNNVRAILRFARDKGIGLTPGSWTSVVDSNILEGIEQGQALFRGKPTASNPAATEWLTFFTDLYRLFPVAGTDQLKQEWATAEQHATDYGVARANAAGLPAPPDNVFTLIDAGDVYRFALQHPAEVRALAGVAGQLVGAQMTALGCTAFQSMCPLLVSFFASSGYRTAGSWLEEMLSDPTNEEAVYQFTGWIYDAGHGLNDIANNLLGTRFP
jgi:RHS repeat-associated protein